MVSELKNLMYLMYNSVCVHEVFVLIQSTTEKHMHL